MATTTTEMESTEVLTISTLWKSAVSIAIVIAYNNDVIRILTAMTCFNIILCAKLMH